MIIIITIDGVCIYIHIVSTQKDDTWYCSISIVQTRGKPSLNVSVTSSLWAVTHRQQFWGVKFYGQWTVDLVLPLLSAPQLSVIQEPEWCKLTKINTNTLRYAKETYTHLLLINPFLFLLRLQLYMLTKNKQTSKCIYTHRHVCRRTTL